MIYLREKAKKVIVAISLLIFSFYYTERIIEFIQSRDPLMKMIKESESRFSIEPIDASIENGLIVPGLSGVNINHHRSFRQMRRFGMFTESLLVFQEVNPSISMDDHFDKFIMSGRGTNNDVSLVFQVNQNDDITEILNILDDKGVLGTFFIDGVWLESNVDLVKEMAENSHQIELLSYAGSFDEVRFNSSLSHLQRTINIRPKYCFALYDQKEIIELCSKLRMHTIIPTIKTGGFPFQEVRSKLNKGSIIGFDVNGATNLELETIINFVQQRGFQINILDHLLSEIRSDQK